MRVTKENEVPYELKKSSLTAVAFEPTTSGCLINHYHPIDLFSYDENHDKSGIDCGLQKLSPSFDRSR